MSKEKSFGNMHVDRPLAKRSSQTCSLEEEGSKRSRQYQIVAVVSILLVVPAIVFVLGYLWIWRTGIAPTSIKSFYAKMLRVIKNGDRWAWNVTTLKGSRISIGTIPTSEKDLRFLVEKENVKYMITLNERWELVQTSPVLLRSAERMQKEFGLKMLNIPTPDYTPSSPRDLARAVKWVKEALATQDGTNGSSRVYVHCNAGRGRSATLVLCLMISLRDMTCEAAFEELSSQRKISKMKGCCGRIRTNHWHAAKRFEREHRKRATAGHGPEAP